MKFRHGFFIFVFLLYVGAFVFVTEKFFEAISKSLNILLSIVPTLLLVFFMMFIVNYFVKPKKLAAIFGKKAGPGAWLFSVVAGIISTGPIFLWFPMLGDLHKSGASLGLVASFLYARAIKIPLIPLMVYYFGALYTIVLVSVLFIFSFLQGIVVSYSEKFLDDSN